MRINRSVILSVIIVLLFSLTALANVNLTFMGWGNVDERRIFAETISAFERKNPEVSVEYVVVTPEEFGDRLLTMIAGGTIPDVFYLPVERLHALASEGLLENLTPYLDRTNVVDVTDVWPQALNFYRWDGTVLGRGDVWALPKDVGPWVMVYNKDLYDRAGIAYPDANQPQLWDEAVSNWQKLTMDLTGDGEADQYAIDAFPVEGAVWSNGADWLNEDRRQVTVSDPRFVEAIQWLADLRHEYGVWPMHYDFTRLGVPHGYGLFISGGMANFGMGPWDQPAFWDLPFEWDIAPWPASPVTGQSRTWLGSLGLTVSSQSQHKELAFELAAFLAFHEEAQRNMYELGQAVPNLISMARDEFMYMDQPPQSRQVFINTVLEYGAPGPNAYTPNTDWLGAFWSGIGQVWDGIKPAHQYLSEIEPTMQALFEERNPR